MHGFPSTKQILVVEKNLSDFALISYALRESGSPCTIRRVQTAAELDEELLRLMPDLVICEEGDEHWDASAMLAQVQAFEDTLPVIVVGACPDEARRAGWLARGASACISKGHLSELTAVISRVRRQHAADRLRRLEEIRRDFGARLQAQAARLRWPAPPVAYAG